MKRKKFYLQTIMILLLFFVFSLEAYAQITFFKTYGNTAKGYVDCGYAVLQTENDGFIVAGEYGQHYIGAPMHFCGDVYIIKTDEYGDTLWTKTYGHPNMWEAAYSMDRTDDGGYIISAFRYDSQSYKLWLIKIDSEGDSIWSKIYPVSKGNCIRQTTDGGYIITGGFSNVYLLKINNYGDVIWLKEYDNDSGRGEGTCVQQTSDNGFIITGLRPWLIKTDSNGDTLWTKTYSGVPRSVCETNDGSFLIAGEYTSQDCEYCELEVHIWLLKTDSSGDTTWTRKIDNNLLGDHVYSMKKTSDGGFILAGETVDIMYDSDVYLIKLDKFGNTIWESTIGGVSGKNFRAYDVEETRDGGYIITGWSNYEDLLLVKVNNEGQITDVKEIESIIPSDFILFQNYPNPFNPVTQIKFQIAQKEYVTLTIFDLLGKEVKVLIDEEKYKGTYIINWDGKDKYGRTVSPGIYIYRFQSVSMSLCKKMVFMK